MSFEIEEKSGKDAPLNDRVEALERQVKDLLSRDDDRNSRITLLEQFQQQIISWKRMMFG